jgi:hypothetical protein
VGTCEFLRLLDELLLWLDLDELWWCVGRRAPAALTADRPATTWPGRPNSPLANFIPTDWPPPPPPSSMELAHLDWSVSEERTFFLHE